MHRSQKSSRKNSFYANSCKAYKFKRIKDNRLEPIDNPDTYVSTRSSVSVEKFNTFCHRHGIKRSPLNWDDNCSTMLYPSTLFAQMLTGFDFKVISIFPFVHSIVLVVHLYSHLSSNCSCRHIQFNLLCAISWRLHYHMVVGKWFTDLDFADFAADSNSCFATLGTTSQRKLWTFHFQLCT